MPWPGYANERSTRLGRTTCESAMGRSRLTVELAILELLDEHDRLEVVRIADAVNAPQGSVDTAIRLLAQQGFVESVGAADNDGRAWVLTDAGRDEVQRWRV